MHVWTYVWYCPINSKQLLGGAIHLMEFQGKPIICLSPFDASCFPTGEPAVRVRSDVMGCNCNGAAWRPGAHIKVGGGGRKEQRDFTFFTFACYFSHAKASFVSTMLGLGGWTGGRSTGCLKCVKEAEKKIFPLGSLLPAWFPFHRRSSWETPLNVVHTSSLSPDPLTQISDRLHSPDPRRPMAEGS